MCYTLIFSFTHQPFTLGSLAIPFLVLPVPFLFLSLLFRIKAKRIGFSVFGSVRSLNGEGEKQLLVEATPLGNDDLPKEDGLSDAEGNYRIRGLKPGVSYRISLRSDSDKNDKNYRVSRSEPSSVDVSIPQVRLTSLNPIPHF